MIIKAVIAVAITVIIVFVLMSSNSVLGNFLSEAGERISDNFPMPSFGKDANRTIEFSVSLDSYKYENFSSFMEGNISVRSSDLRLEVNGAGVKTDRQLKIIGYKGIISMSDTFSIDGSFQEMRLADVIFKTKGSVKGEGYYDMLGIEGLSLSEIVINGTGSVEIGKIKLTVEGEKIRLVAPEGEFFFLERLEAKGMCKHAEVGGMFKASSS